MLRYLLVLASTSLGTQLLRLVFLGRKTPPKTPAFLKRAMEYVPVSILAALVFQEFFLGQGPLAPRLIAALAAILLFLGLARDLITILGGLIVYWAATMVL
jgi:branched-subunit amino acid transport protein